MRIDSSLSSDAIPTMSPIRSKLPASKPMLLRPSGHAHVVKSLQSSTRNSISICQAIIRSP